MSEQQVQLSLISYITNLNISKCSHPTLKFSGAAITHFLAATAAGPAIIVFLVSFPPNPPPDNNKGSYNMKAVTKNKA